MISSVFVLIEREILRFLRQRSRMFGVIASPILFWFVIGSGLHRSFSYGGFPGHLTYLEYLYPGTLILVVLFAAVFSSISIIEDRAEGFLQAVLASPAPRMAIVIGKVAGITALATLQAGLFLIAAPFVTPDVSAGALVLTAAVVAVVAFGLSSMGFLIAWSMESTQGFHAVMNLLLVPLWLLSGALFPQSGAAEWVAELMKWNPLTYGVAATRRALYGLSPDIGSEVPEFGLSIAIVCAFSIILIAAATMQVHQRRKSA